MGQSSSRHQDPARLTPVTSTNAAASASTAQQEETSTGIDADASGSRRSSLRKNILKLVKPKNIRNRLSGIPSKSREGHSTWRDSRRLSKSPESSSKIAESLPATSPDVIADESIKIPSSFHDKGKQPADKDLEEEEEGNDSNDATPGLVVEPKNDNFVMPVETASSVSASVAHATEDTVHDIQPPPESEYHVSDTALSSLSQSIEPETTSTTSPQPPLSTTSQPPNTPGARQFPPPGTLVVVQGIVHTTDVSRPSSVSLASSPSENTTTSTSRNPRTDPSPEPPLDQSTNRARNRLSSLLRPRSVSSRPSSTIINESPVSPSISESANASTVPESQPTPPDSLQAGNLLSSSNLEGAAVDSPRPVDAQAENRAPLISSSSIDVLGTLLSVAAAATAASLLTGSSEPILSSGLAPSEPLSSPPVNAVPPPFSSPPTAIPNNSNPGISAAGRAERMRQAWSSIRERLGLRHSPTLSGTSSLPSLSHDGPSDTTPASAPADTRELMLAEMARAFNIGLGLNGLGNVGNSGSSDEPGTSPENLTVPTNSDTSNEFSSLPVAENESSRRPPEGSFERFLVDLQADLRTALSQPAASEEQAQDATTTSAPDVNLDSAPYHRAPTPMPDDLVHDFDDMPGLTEISDSESESSNNDNETRTNTNQAQGGIEETSRAAAGRIDASGRINWWRLYRFPPVSTPRADGAGPRRPGSDTYNTFARYRQAQTPESDNERDTTGSSTPSSQQPPSSIVPVIVVGLQSVNQEWRVDIPGPEDGDFFGPPPTEGMGSESVESHLDSVNGNRHTGAGSAGVETIGSRGNGRPRGWHSRAASAIRNLRPGRRGTDGGPENRTTAAPGSRTFLIYVIGGYYPPDHSIVTGGPDILDSFEALLELADLLGQVKPPTVTKDDIEKSGLQIIKASEMGQYEKEGKVASNCLDRCLICLDDYEPEDPIRVMTCRHAFHKSCVDEWLQKGRNNCPACRSTGVNTDVADIPARSDMQEPLEDGYVLPAVGRYNY